jgi:chemosensory pili system protein ChpA (sensor histidine kinase/response regulator)
MRYMGNLLDHNVQANLDGVTKPLPVLLLHGAEHPTAVQVDELMGSREVVVKSVGQQLSLLSGLSGATILGDGRVVLILDVPALTRRADAVIDQDETVEDVYVEDKIPTVMVVDDSITVRKVTQRLLNRYDYDVITAKDGVDALTVLADNNPDVMLLDIEMPRMDGFELATILKHDEKTKDLPIIMITSRTGEKHRERAESIGVNRYMGKPYNEVDLLATIESLLSGKD